MASESFGFFAWLVAKRAQLFCLGAFLFLILVVGWVVDSDLTARRERMSADIIALEERVKKLDLRIFSLKLALDEARAKSITAIDETYSRGFDELQRRIAKMDFEPRLPESR